MTNMNFLLLASSALLAAASPVRFSGPIHSGPVRRAVDQLNREAFEEAQQRDDTATRAFAGTLIKTADNRCLFVNELSGDFRANLTPIQIADCGTTEGQEWDIITAGKHNNARNSMLIVSTLTQACFNFDPRRAAGNQALLFSCGGRADGGGAVTDSQLFPFNGGAGPLSFSPENDPDTCFTVENNVVDVAPCQSGDLRQLFTFGDALTFDPAPSSTGAAVSSTSIPAFTSTPIATQTSEAGETTATSTAAQDSTSAPAPTSSSGNLVGGVPNPTEAVPVSGAGGLLQPTAVAESHERDDGATRAFTSVSIQAPDGRCLFIDPTAGDFRENLIPVSLVTCAGTPNEKFDFITAGKHNNAEDSALIVSSLMNGCISFDGRRQRGDTVTIFSCGGRADGGGETNSGQLIPFTGGNQFVFSPVGERNATCIVAGDQRLDSESCSGDDSQVFTILS